MKPFQTLKNRGVCLKSAFLCPRQIQEKKVLLFFPPVKRGIDFFLEQFSSETARVRLFACFFSLHAICFAAASSSSSTTVYRQPFLHNRHIRHSFFPFIQGKLAQRKKTTTSVLPHITGRTPPFATAGNESVASNLSGGSCCEQRRIIINPLSRTLLHPFFSSFLPLEAAIHSHSHFACFFSPLFLNCFAG